MAANTDDARRLNSAILGVSKEVLAVLMMKIVQDHPSMRDFVEGHLLVNENQVPRPGTPSDSDNDLEDSDNSDDCDESEASEKKVTAVPDSTTQAGPKRMRTRYSTCSNCKEEFDVSENTRKSCSYHPCYSEPDDDLFPDHDELCHGPMDTEENRRNYPEKFTTPAVSVTAMKSHVLPTGIGSLSAMTTVSRRGRSIKSGGGC